MSLYKNCEWWKKFDCKFEFSVKNYVINIIKFLHAKIVFPSVIYWIERFHQAITAVQQKILYKPTTSINTDILGLFTIWSSNSYHTHTSASKCFSLQFFLLCLKLSLAPPQENKALTNFIDTIQSDILSQAYGSWYS